MDLSDALVALSDRTPAASDGWRNLLFSRLSILAAATATTGQRKRSEGNHG